MYLKKKVSVYIAKSILSLQYMNKMSGPAIIIYTLWYYSFKGAVFYVYYKLNSHLVIFWNAKSLKQASGHTCLKNIAIAETYEAKKNGLIIVAN